MSRKVRTVPDHCPECGSDNLFSGYFDGEDLGYPINQGDTTPPDVRWTTFCMQCGEEVLAR